MSGNLKQSDPSPRSHGDLIYELKSVVRIDYMRIYGKPENSDRLIVSKPGMLDDTSQWEPRVEICLKSAHTCFESPDHTEKYKNNNFKETCNKVNRVGEGAPQERI